MMGQPLMPWQRLVADVSGEIDPKTGLPAYREVGVTIHRQAGKTTLILATEIDRGVGFGRPQLILYSAQDGGAARKKLLEDQVPMLERSDLWPLVRKVYRANDNTGLLFVTGSKIDVIASSESAGHGRSPDLGVIDEAFADVDARREQSIIPGMATKADGQLLVYSTAGTGDSVYLRNKVDTGRASAAEGLTSGVAYFEWSADDDDDPADESVWWRSMPALGHTISIEVVRHAFRTMALGEFQRAFLNQWTASDERVIPLAVWEAVQRGSGQAAPSGDVTFAVDVNPERSAAAIAVAGAGVCEVVAFRPGTAWVLDHLVNSAGRWGGTVVVDVSGPAGSLVADLERAGVKVHPVKAGDMAKACGEFYDAVADGKVEILRHGGLNDAVAGAVKRAVGDAWVWARKTATADVSPLVAVTAAWSVSLGAGPSVYESRGFVTL